MLKKLLFLAAALSLVCQPANAQYRSRISGFGGDARDGNLVVSTSLKETYQAQRNYENATVNTGTAWVIHSDSQINTTGALTVNGAIVLIKDFLAGGPGEQGAGPGSGGGGADGASGRGDGGGGGGGCGGRGGDGGHGRYNDGTSGICGGGGPGLTLALPHWGGCGGGGGSQQNNGGYAFFGGRGARHSGLDYTYYVLLSSQYKFHRSWLLAYAPPGGDYTADGSNHAGSSPGIARFICSGQISVPSTGCIDASGSDGGGANSGHEGGQGAAAAGQIFMYSQTGIVINGLIMCKGGDGGDGIGNGGGGGAGSAGNVLGFCPGGITGSGTITLTGGSHGHGGGGGGHDGNDGAGSTVISISGYPTLPLITDLDQHGGFLMAIGKMHPDRKNFYNATAKETAQMMASFHGSKSLKAFAMTINSANNSITLRSAKN